MEEEVPTQKPTKAITVKETLERKAKKFPPVTVDKEDNLIYDLGNLAAFDPSPIDKKAYKENASQYLLELSRDNVQLMITHMFNLPTSKDSNGIYANLPKLLTLLPREKAIPKPKPLTKWEKFAQEKGIKKRKKSRMTFDDQGSLKPSWGYKRANDDNDEWIIEAKKNDDPNVDPFTAKTNKKKDFTTKQTKRESKNRKLAEKNLKSGLPGTINLANQPPNTRKFKSEVGYALDIASKSTVSMGKFDEPLDKKKKMLKKKQKR